MSPADQISGLISSIKSLNPDDTLRIYDLLGGILKEKGLLLWEIPENEKKRKKWSNIVQNLSDFIKYNSFNKIS